MIIVDSRYGRNSNDSEKLICVADESGSLSLAFVIFSYGNQAYLNDQFYIPL